MMEIRKLPNGKEFEIVDTGEPFADHLSPQCKTGGFIIYTIRDGKRMWLDNVETREDVENFLYVVGR